MPDPSSDARPADSGDVAGEKAQYHPRPSPHFVFSEAVWTNTKDQIGTARDDGSIAGQIGVLTGTPVYIDRCPWDCERQTPEVIR